MDPRASRAARTPQHHAAITRERIDKATSHLYLVAAESNLTRIRYSAKSPVKLAVWRAPGLCRRLGFSEAISTVVWDPVSEGHSFGPSWSTHWVRLEFRVPAEWPRPTLVFDPGCEALLYSADGEPLQGITGGDAHEFRGNRHVELSLTPSPELAAMTLYAEVACNGLFGAGRDGMINAPDPDRQFTLASCEVVNVDPVGHELFWDFVVVRMTSFLVDNSVRMTPSPTAAACSSATSPASPTCPPLSLPEPSACATPCSTSSTRATRGPFPAPSPWLEKSSPLSLRATLAPRSCLTPPRALRGAAQPLLSGPSGIVTLIR